MHRSRWPDAVATLPSAEMMLRMEYLQCTIIEYENVYFQKGSAVRETFFEDGIPFDDRDTAHRACMAFIDDKMSHTSGLLA